MRHQMEIPAQGEGEFLSPGSHSCWLPSLNNLPPTSLTWPQEMHFRCQQSIDFTIHSDFGFADENWLDRQLESLNSHSFIAKEIGVAERMPSELIRDTDQLYMAAPNVSQIAWRVGSATRCAVGPPA